MMDAVTMSRTEHFTRGEWSDLQGLPLLNIALGLENAADFCSVGHACTSWRSAFKDAKPDFMASQPPWLCGVEYNRLYNIGEERFYTKRQPAGHRQRWALGFSSGHLIAAERKSVRRLFLANPLTGTEVHRFPEAPHAYSRAVLTSPATSPDCMFLLYNSRMLQYCRLGDDEWGIYWFPESDAAGPVSNIAVLGGRVYVLTANGYLGTIDFRPSPELTFMDTESFPVSRFKSIWLGMSCGALVAISCSYQYPRAISGFVVRKFDFLTRKWVKVESLGGRSLFIDMNWGVLSDEPTRWTGGAGDSIYFTDPIRNSLAVFSIKDGCIKDLVPSSGKGKFRWDMSIWIIPSLCI